MSIEESIEEWPTNFLVDQRIIEEVLVLLRTVLPTADKQVEEAIACIELDYYSLARDILKDCDIIDDNVRRALDILVPFENGSFRVIVVSVTEEEHVPVEHIAERMRAKHPGCGVVVTIRWYIVCPTDVSSYAWRADGSEIELPDEFEPAPGLGSYRGLFGERVL